MTLSLAVNSQGQGPQLTLVHGWGLGSGAWALVSHLLAKHFTVHNVDLPGYGASPPAPGASLEDLADALAATLPPRAMVCGWSLGALVCLMAAQRHPDKIARLVLVGATASFVQREGWLEALPPAQLAAFMDGLAADPAALLKQFASLIHQGDAHMREAIRALRGCLAGAEGGLPADPASLRAGLALLGESDLRPLLSALRQPVLLIHGAADPLMPLAAAERLQDRLPTATLSVFADSAHAPFASDPLRFVRELTDFAGVGG
ncbi:pimeloyl-ACP methyl ester esterase BioH [Denitratisoma sp. agr-D3]